MGTADGPTQPVPTIDLNCDMGESFGRWRLGEDEALMGVVTSANVAGGFHAGDPSVLRATCAAAARQGVTVGAQVGYPDLIGFGRRFIDIAPSELADAVLYQVAALAGICAVEGARLAFVKPHGALYHAASTHPAQGEAILRAVGDISGDLAIMAASGSAFLAAARGAGLRTIAEVFADRGYQADGTLVPRSHADALLRPVDVGARVEDLVAGRVTAVDGTTVRVEVQSICVHGDTPDAVAVATAARAALEAAGVEVASTART